MADQPPSPECSPAACNGLTRLDKETAVAIGRLETRIEERDRDRDRERDRLDELARNMQAGFDGLKQHVSTCIESQDAKRREDIQGVYSTIGELDGRLHTLKNLFITGGLALLGGIIVALVRG